VSEPDVIVVLETVWDTLTVYVPTPPEPERMAVIVVPAVTPVPVMIEPMASAPEVEAVIVSVVVAIDPVPENPTTMSLTTITSLPTVMLPAESLTMLLTVPEGWMTLMVLRVLMAASY